ncbi:hypothetical protein ACHQM5_010466 [Ranunculus cassubicifolius]
MDHIKGEKLQSKKKHKRNQFVDNLILFSFITLSCILFCSSPLWMPPIYSFMKTLVFVYIPYMKTYISSPKCLFILCNIIVVILIGESKLVGSNSSARATTDIYNEYVNRSETVRNARFLEEKKGNEMKVDAYEIEESVQRDDEMDEKTVEEEKESDVEEEKLCLPTEELNKRVEDFIARVNKQRMLEARLLFSE